MKQRRAMLHLAWIGLLLVTVAGVPATSEGTTGAPDDVLVGAADAPVADLTPADLPAAELPAVDPPLADPPAPGDFTPVACRMEPQCWANADCVAWCGPTGGRCVHAHCPIRICKCN